MEIRLKGENGVCSGSFLQFKVNPSIKFSSGGRDCISEYFSEVPLPDKAGFCIKLVHQAAADLGQIISRKRSGGRGGSDEILLESSFASSKLLMNSRPQGRDISVPKD